MENVIDVYLTKDLGEAAALISKGAKMLRLQQESSFFWFVFQDKPLCEKLSNEFWSGELQVSAKTYADSIRSLKDRLFARR
jgi:hypothetical protein